MKKIWMTLLMSGFCGLVAMDDSTDERILWFGGYGCSHMGA